VILDEFVDGVAGHEAALGGVMGWRI